MNKLAYIIFLLFPMVIIAQTDEEVKLLELINYCRTEPKQFLNEYVRPYLEENELEHISESRSLVRTLDKLKPLKPMQFANDLQTVAREHAVDMGKKGLTGHRGFSSRYKKHANRYDEVAENCSYGFDGALDILMQLLIDEDIADLGHRKNLLAAEYNYIGIHIAPHKTEVWNCVMAFGGK